MYGRCPHVLLPHLHHQQRHRRILLGRGAQVEVQHFLQRQVVLAERHAPKQQDRTTHG